jgi:hypothetical protein
VAFDSLDLQYYGYDNLWLIVQIRKASAEVNVPKSAGATPGGLHVGAAQEVGERPQNGSSSFKKREPPTAANRGGTSRRGRSSRQPLMVLCTEVHARRPILHKPNSTKTLPLLRVVSSARPSRYVLVMGSQRRRGARSTWARGCRCPMALRRSSRRSTLFPSRSRSRAPAPIGSSQGPRQEMPRDHAPSWIHGRPRRSAWSCPQAAAAHKDPQKAADAYVAVLRGLGLMSFACYMDRR